MRNTTGLGYFAECHKHSATTLPSVAHGEAHTAFHLPAKPALPSAVSRALGKVLSCAKSYSAKKSVNGTGERDERDGRTGRETGTLPSALKKALGEVLDVAEC